MAKCKNPRGDWAPYVRQVADQMGLRDWNFEVSHGPPCHDHDGRMSMAEIEPVYGRRYAVMWLSDFFLNSSRQEQRDTIVHELVHCHCAMAQQIALDELKPSIQRQYMIGQEYAVDGLASVISRFMPLPPRPKKDE